MNLTFEVKGTFFSFTDNLFPEITLLVIKYTINFISPHILSFQINVSGWQQSHKLNFKRSPVRLLTNNKHLIINLLTKVFYSG